MKSPVYLLPPVAWFVELAKNKNKLNLDAEALFLKQSLRNRYWVIGPNKTQILTVPIDGNTKNETIRQVRVSYAENWISGHLNALKTAYGKSPFFEFYDYKIEAIFKLKIDSVFELNMAFLDFAFKALQMEVSISTNTITDRHTRNEAFYWQQMSESLPAYKQVFDNRFGFVPFVSIIDLIFNKGPNAGLYIEEAAKLRHI